MQQLQQTKPTISASHRTQLYIITPTTIFHKPDLATLDPYITTYTQPIYTFHKTRSHQS